MDRTKYSLHDGYITETIDKFNCINRLLLEMQNVSERPIFRKNTFARFFQSQISSHEQARTFCQRIIKSATVICI